LRFQESFKKYVKIIEDFLQEIIPEKDEKLPLELLQAVRYTLFAGGKRIRPVLTLAAAEIVGADHKKALPLAAGIEMIHTYSLIHDDLPAMDDDDFRRGKPTCHKVFGEATAILAGDALLTFSFQIMGNIKLYPPDISAERVLFAIEEIAKAAGIWGMVAGQIMDLKMEGKEKNPEARQALEWIHTHKTAKMIEVSLKAGAIVAEAEKWQIKALADYGRKIGLCFQITDDILNFIGDEKKLGKPVKTDSEKRKLTYPALYGLDASKKKAKELAKEATEDIKPFKEKGWFLKELAKYIFERET